MIRKGKASMENVLFSMSRDYLQHKKMECLKEHGKYIQNDEFKIALISLEKYENYSEKYDFIDDLFWKKYDMNYERIKRLCTK